MTIEIVGYIHLVNVDGKEVEVYENLRSKKIYKVCVEDKCINSEEIKAVVEALKAIGRLNEVVDCM